MVNVGAIFICLKNQALSKSFIQSMIASFSNLQAFNKSQVLKEYSTKVSRLTNDSVTSRQDAVDYPIKQDSIWEKSGHDLPYETTESSSLREEIRHAGKDKLN